MIDERDDVPRGEGPRQDAVRAYYAEARHLDRERIRPGLEHGETKFATGVGHRGDRIHAARRGGNGRPGHGAALRVGHQAFERGGLRGRDRRDQHRERQQSGAGQDAWRRCRDAAFG